MRQIVQIIGALLVLAAYILAQFRVLGQDSRRYLSLNFVGSLILAVLAAQDRQWGFLLLEGVWAILSLWGLIGPRRRGIRVQQQQQPLKESSS